MWFFLLILLFLVVLIYFYVIKPLKFWKDRGVPYVQAWPIFGNMASNVFRRRAFAHMIEDVYKSHPNKRYVGFYAFSSPTLMIRDPELIKQITVKHFEAFPQHRSIATETSDPLWNKGLFPMKYEDGWHDKRATLSPSFTSSKLRTMFGLMQKCAEEFINYFQEQDGIVTIEMKDTFTRYTNDVIGTTAFGVSCNSLREQENEFYLMGKDASNFSGIRALKFFGFLFCPILMRLLKIGVFSEKVQIFFRSLIKKTIKIREEQAIVRPDMIHLLLEARKGRLKHENANNVPDSGFAVVQESEFGKTQKNKDIEITDEDITAMALIFFLAGFDTASNLLCYVAYELALNPDIQERLCSEINEAPKDENKRVTYESLLGMKYLDMIISETLRKWAPAVMADRQSVKPFTIKAEQEGENDLYLETGAVCWIPIYAIHRDSNYYPNPEKFDPERFSDENKHNIKPFTYLPFGAGPRNCIGSRFALLESKLITVEILQKFEIIPVEKTQIPIKISKTGFNLMPDEGIWLGLKPRTKYIN